MSSPERESGFTLVEMMVALAIFSLAALALMRLEGAAVTGTERLERQALAEIVARNLAAETLSDPAPPAFGLQRGETVNGGRRWRWSRATHRSPESRIQQIEIRVAAAQGPGEAALVLFRRAAQ
jgi:general secretion pathway protein I